jgi:hypothetical protein
MSRWVVTIILLVLATPLACISSLVVDELYLKLIDPDDNLHYYNKTWRVLPLPPERAIRFAGITPGIIYIETNGGRIFGCFKASDVDFNCWFEVDDIPPPDESLDYYLGWDCPGPDVFIEIYSGYPSNVLVKEFTQIKYCAISFREWKRSEFRYVLTDKGEVWQWGYDGLDSIRTPKVDGMTWNLFPIFIGCLAGYLLPISVVFYIWQNKKNE